MLIVARHPFLFSFIAATFSIEGAAAQTNPPSATPPSASGTSSPDPSDIVIVAEAPGKSAIDRRTYVVRDNAEARSSNALDLLAKIPFVDVTRSGQVRLLGNTGVKILVDGKEVPDTATALRNLQGAQIARIEVSSNPSAEFSAQGTAGVINIITRRQFASGLGGSLTASAGSFGNYEVKVSPTWSRNALSLSGGFNLSSSTTPTEFERQRIDFNSGDGTSAASSEKGGTRTRSDNAAGNFLVSYKLSPKQTLSFNASGFQADQRTTGSSVFSFGGVPSSSSSQTTTGNANVYALDGSLDYQREGSREGESLTVSSKWSRSRVKTKYLFLTDNSGALDSFGLTSDSTYSTSTFKVDYVNPSGKDKRLSAGVSLVRASGNLLSRYGGDISNGASIAATSFVIRGSWLEKSAYLTYQRPALGGTLLGGLRFEGRRYDLATNLVQPPPGGDRFFPSLYFERKLGKQLSANLSYSRRVAWPGITDLNPALRFSDATTANAGNPELRPELTDSYEAKLKLGVSKQDVEMTFFLRTTRGTWTDSTVLKNDGVLVRSVVNLGTRTLRGASLSIQGPLGGGFRYSLSGNLADQSFNGQLQPDLAGVSAQYDASAEIEYRDGTEGRRGADHIALSVRYNGPTSTYLYRSSPAAGADLSWSHAFTDRLWSVLKITDLFGAQPNKTYSYSVTSFAQDVNRAPGPSFMLTLTYSLGQPPQR